MLRFTQHSREISQKDAEITKGRHHKTKTLNLPSVVPVASLRETFLRRGCCVAEMHRLTAGHFAVEYRLGTFFSRSIGFTKRLCPVKSSSEN
jgi:hypothetical protein